MLFGAASVSLVRWEGVQDEVVVVAAWGGAGSTPGAGAVALSPGSARPDTPCARDGGRLSRNRVLAGARVGIGDRRAGDRHGTAVRCAHRRTSRRGSIPCRRRDQAPQLRRSRGAVDRERARPGRAACVARADRADGRRGAPPAGAESSRRRAAATRLRLARVTARRADVRGQSLNCTCRAARGLERARGRDAGVARTRAWPASSTLERTRTRACARRALRPLPFRRRDHRRARGSAPRRRSRRRSTTSSRRA